MILTRIVSRLADRGDGKLARLAMLGATIHSHALDRGATVVLVRDILGHSSLAITSRYTHAKPNESSALHLAV